MPHSNDCSSCYYKCLARPIEVVKYPSPSDSAFDGSSATYAADAITPPNFAGNAFFLLVPAIDSDVSIKLDTWLNAEVGQPALASEKWLLSDAEGSSLLSFVGQSRIEADGTTLTGEQRDYVVVGSVGPRWRRAKRVSVTFGTDESNTDRLIKIFPC